MRANRYVSYLAAEIEPKAIATLNQFEREATKVMEKIASAGARGTAGAARGSLFGVQTTQLRALSTAADPVARKIGDIDRAQVRAAASGGLMSNSLRRAGQALQIVQGPLGPLAGRLSALSDVMTRLTGFSLAGVLGAGGAFALGSIASQYQNMTDRLRPLYDDQVSLNKALGDVVGIAQRSRQALEPVVELYAKMTLAGRAAGISDARSARIAELASKAARISGGGAATQQAGLTQFAQGFGSGTLSGDELKSIKENTLFLAKSIADGLGVPIAKLKELGAAGKLTPQVIEAAMLRSADSIDAAFSKLPKRIGSSLTQLSTNFSVFIGQIDTATGSTETIANGLSFLAENLGLVTQAATLAAAAFAASSFARFADGIVVAGRNSAIAARNIFQLAAAVQAGNAVMIGGAQAAQQRAQHIADGARVEAEAARVAVNSAQAYRGQLNANLSLLDKQIAAQRKALDTSRLLNSATLATGGRSTSDAVKIATEDLNRSLRARILTQQQLVATDAELAAADARVTAATTALIAAEEGLVVADTAAAASSGRLAGAKIVLQGAITRVQAAGAGLVNFLGGPWGVAFTAAAGLAFYLATRVDEAKVATDNFKGSQAGLPGYLDNTTDALLRQSAAARQLAVDLQRAEVVKARAQAHAVGDQLSGDLFAAVNNISGFQTMRSAQARKDKERLRQIAAEAKAGNFNLEQHYQELSGIRERNPAAFEGGLVQRLFGMDPSRLTTDVVGLDRALRSLKTTKEDLEKIEKAPAAKPGLPDLGLSGKPKTTAQLNREAAIAAATSPLKKARAELAAAKGAGKLTDESDQQYIDRIAQMTQNVNQLADAEKAATKAKRDGAAAQNKLNREIESASDKRDKLLGIMDRYDQDTPIKRLERLRDEAEKAKRAIDDLVGEKVEGFKGAFKQSDADRLKGQIDVAVDEEARRPVTDSLKQGREQLDLLELQARGMGDLAELTRRRVELEKQVGELMPEELEELRHQIADEHRLNDVLEQRNAIIENNAQFLGQVRDAGRDAIRAFLGGDIKGGIKNFARQIKNAFLDAKANEIAIKLFGDPEKKYRDEMTRGLNSSADRLTGSSDKLDRSAVSLDRAADALTNSVSGAARPIVTADGTISPGLLGNGVGGGPFGDLASAIGDLSQSVSHPTTVDENGDIVVTGTRPKKLGPIQMPGGVDSVLDDAFSSIFGGPAGIASALAQGAGVLAGKGSIGSKVEGLMGVAAQAIAAANPIAAIGLMAQNVIGSALGIKQRGGGLFGLLGSVVINKLFPKKTKKGSATITNLSGNYTIGGNSSGAKEAATGAAGSVTEGLQRILDALGGTLGAFAVSIGTRDGDYRVDTTGRGNTKKSGTVKDFNEDAEAAIRFAIMDAIQDGAIQGIREGSKRLLKAGKDLDLALEKAMKFEDVFKRLKRFKDPVGAAVDDVNTEFQNLIRIFQEAGASAAEWADLEELYGLERADAIKQATQATTSALDDFIKSLTSGPDSPLSRRTVYENAKAEVDKFRSDIAGGKAVDQDALITALQNFQSASEELNGSRSQFFTDFADILSLAEAARGNVPGPAAGGPLPPSPFENLSPLITVGQQQIGQQQITNNLLAQLLAAAGGGGSTIDILPGADAGGGDPISGATSGGLSNTFNLNGRTFNTSYQ